MSKDQPSAIPAVIDRLLETSDEITSGDVARTAGVSRQGRFITSLEWSNAANSSTKEWGAEVNIGEPHT